MKIRTSTAEDPPLLAAIWRASVLATHDFLSKEDFQAIELLVAGDYLPHSSFEVALNDAGTPIGFMGMSGAHIDSLFIHPSYRGVGVGKALMFHARALAAGKALTVEVNEQNVQAVGFYLAHGLRQTARSSVDSAGRPYPTLTLAELG